MASNEPALEPLAEEKTETTHVSDKEDMGGVTSTNTVVQEPENRSNAESASPNKDSLRERKPVRGMLKTMFK